ncbi:hypothetical protein LOK49_LG01G01754 [Camellia lanceoleosa]|uniref:Uncharacterized protein n=1 Tax=Camellia lanceoleosa TaxID=1840588 RepID=A0ACC0IWR7_9ERIC|nr:hypothetical protein LOK49_LG01G01754 [Camellia lanceoleosa]
MFYLFLLSNERERVYLLLESNLASLVQLWNKYENLLFGETGIARRRSDDNCGRFPADGGARQRLEAQCYNRTRDGISEALITHQHIDQPSLLSRRLQGGEVTHVGAEDSDIDAGREMDQLLRLLELVTVASKNGDASALRGGLAGHGEVDAT